MKKRLWFIPLGGGYKTTPWPALTLWLLTVLVFACGSVSMSLPLLTGLSCNLCQPWVLEEFMLCQTLLPLGMPRTVLFHGPTLTQDKGASEPAWELGHELWNSETPPGYVV